MIIPLMGAPGVGKGTYGAMLYERLSIPSVSTGDICRETIEIGGPLGEKVDTLISKGNFVDDPTMLQMLVEKMKRLDAPDMFLDGYPRTLPQAYDLDTIATMELVIYLSFPEEMLVNKISGRMGCPDCKRIYNVKDLTDRDRGIYMVPLAPKTSGICDDCNAPLAQREDDAGEIVHHRLKVYHKLTEPVVDLYRERGVLNTCIVDSPPDIMVSKLINIIQSSGENLK